MKVDLHTAIIMGLALMIHIKQGLKDFGKHGLGKILLELPGGVRFRGRFSCQLVLLLSLISSD